MQPLWCPLTSPTTVSHLHSAPEKTSPSWTCFSPRFSDRFLVAFFAVQFRMPTQWAARSDLVPLPNSWGRALTSLASSNIFKWQCDLSSLCSIWCLCLRLEVEPLAPFLQQLFSRGELYHLDNDFEPFGKWNNSFCSNVQSLAGSSSSWMCPDTSLARSLRLSFETVASDFAEKTCLTQGVEL